MPLSPSIYVIRLLHAAVFRNAGSYVIIPKSSSLILICRRSVAWIVSFSIGTSYCLPVRLSVIVRLFLPFEETGVSLFFGVVTGAFELGMLNLLLVSSR